RTLAPHLKSFDNLQEKPTCDFPNSLFHFFTLTILGNMDSADKSSSKVLTERRYLLAAACLLLARLAPWQLSIGAALVALTVQLLLFIQRAWSRRTNRPQKSVPPLVPGLPLIGSGHEFRRNAVPFLLNCRRKFGDMFTCNFPLGQKIHFLMNPHYVQQFSSTRSFDFHPIQRVVNSNVFRFQAPQETKMLRHMCKHARLAFDTDATVFSGHANRSFELVSDGLPLADKEPKEILVNDFITETMFRSIFNTVYGDCDSKEFNYRAVKQLFKPIHKSFIYIWLGLPSWLFPSTEAAWRTIYKVFPGAKQLLQEGTANAYVRDCLSKWLDGTWTEETVAGHNMVYLHVYHNNCKIAFWLINNLMHNPEQAAKLLEEIEAAVAPDNEEDSNSYRVSVETLEYLPILGSCVQETYRLASGLFLMREVTEDTQFSMEDGQAWNLSKGDLISMYPPSFHRDPTIYDEPESFCIDRFAGEFRPCYEGREVKRPVLPYGVLCPGQRLSMLQLKLYTCCLLLNYRLTPCSDSPPAEYDFASYGDEILPPTQPDCRMGLQLRSGSFKPLHLVQH
uniref:Cytochrome P450 n=2 Tax=Macrostomum lignano TaxID=282301 RepID=A0A1I8HMK7_9PLAT